MRERIPVLIKTTDGDSFLDRVPQSTLDRLTFQRSMLNEIGEETQCPMMETSDGDFVFVKDILPIQEI